MSNKKALETEQKLYHLVERMGQIRHDMQTGRTDPAFAHSRIDALQAEYARIKRDGPEADDEEENDLSTWDEEEQE